MTRSVDRRPLTTAEQALWYAQQLDPGNPAYLCAHAVTLRGPVDVVRLRAAVLAVTAAADNLHLTVAVGAAADLVHAADAPPAADAGHAADVPYAARVLQAVDAPRAANAPRAAEVPHAVAHPPADCPVHDLRDAPDPDARAAAWMRADATTAVPLDRPGLFAQALLVLPDRVVWYLRAHHLLLDGYGFTLLTDRVAAAYRDPAAAAASFPPAVRLTADERRYRDTPRHGADRDHWHAHLADRPAAASLTDVVAAPAVPHRIRAALPGDTATGLRAAAAALGVAWPELALAAAALYLHRATGGDEVALGVPLMNRLGTGAAKIPSSVVNVLPLWLTVRADDTPRTLVDRLVPALAAVRRHGRYRYEDLQRDLGVVGTGRRLHGPCVNIKPYPEPLRFGDLTAEVEVLATGPVPDLEFTLWPDPAGAAVHLSVAANPAAYRRGEAAAHRDRLAHLLAQLAAADPDAPLADLEIATPAERHRVLHEWNATAAPLPDTTLTALLDRHAAADATAVVAEDGTLTYADLHARADRLAAALAARGAGPGTRVALALPRGRDLVVALLAVLKSGAAYLPLELDHPPARTAELLAAARPGCLLTRADIAAQRAGGTPWLDPADPPAAPAGARPRPATPDDPAYVIYTSGSTGAPKGVVVPHRGIVNRLRWMQRHFALAADDRVLQKTPYGFDVSVWEFFWPLTQGATLVVARPDGHRDPDYLAALICDARVTTVHFVPSMLRAFLSARRAGGCGAVLRRVVCSGEELPAELVRRFHAEVGAPLHNLYGPTEASVDVTWYDCAGDETGPVPIGRPVDNTRCYVLDPAGHPAPPGVPGELHLAGVQLATGYLNRPDLTRERFLPDPFHPGERMYRTGDIARWRADGLLEFRGRADRQVKVRGFRVEPGEVEAALLAAPGVAAAAVTVRPESPDRLVGYVVMAGADPDLGALRRLLADRLPDHLVPADLVPLPALPLTTSGKLDRGALPAPRREVSAAAPRTPREQLLCALAARVLDLPRVGPHDNFFDLGGHSLRAAALVAAVREATGLDLPLRTVFAAPTAAGLVAALADPGRPDGALDVLLPLRVGAGGPALFCVHPAGGLSWCYAGLLAGLPRHVPVYGFQSPLFTDPAAVPDSIDALARRYVAEIRAVQPRGPYRLAGWSVGGVIAHAMAVRLRAAGARVDLLALLDAYPAEQWRDLPAPDEAETLRALLYMGGADESAVDGPLTRDAVRTALRDRGNAMAALEPDTLATVADAVRVHAGLMRAHRHAPCDTPAVLFAATAPRAETWLDGDGWRAWLTGGLAVHPHDCTHPELVRPDRLAAIGAVLAATWDPPIHPPDQARPGPYPPPA